MNFLKITIIFIVLPFSLIAEDNPYSPILTFHFEEKISADKEIRESFVLTKTEFNRGVKAFNGDAKAFLRKYLLDLFLSVECQKHEGKKRVSSLFESKETYVPSQPWIEKMKEDQPGKKENIEAYFRSSVLQFLIEEKMRDSGYDRDSFSPLVLYDFYKKRKTLYEYFLKQQPSIDTTQLASFFEDHPEMRFLMIPEGVNLQSLWFVIPNLQKYPPDKIQSMYDDIFLNVGDAQEESFKIVLNRARAILKEPTAEHYSFLEALYLALEVSVGQYGVIHKDKFSKEAFLKTKESLIKERELFFSKTKSYLCSVMDRRREETETMYHKLIQGRHETSQKIRAFQVMAEALTQQHAEEIIYMKPEWVAALDEPLPTEIREASFGKQRRKPGNVEAYYENEGPHVALALFQWMDYRPMRFLDFSDVGKKIQDFLVETAFARLKPQVERELYRQYRDHIVFPGLPDLTNLDILF